MAAMFRSWVICTGGQSYGVFLKTGISSNWVAAMTRGWSLNWDIMLALTDAYCKFLSTWSWCKWLWVSQGNIIRFAPLCNQLLRVVCLSVNTYYSCTCPSPSFLPSLVTLSPMKSFDGYKLGFACIFLFAITHDPATTLNKTGLHHRITSLMLLKPGLPDSLATTRS